MGKLKELFGDDKVILWKDEEGLCVHIMHRANTAQVLGTESVSALRIANLAVTDLKPFQRMIDSDFFRFSPWRPPVRYPAASVELPVASGSVDMPVTRERSGSASLVTADGDDDGDDVRPRLRSSTFDFEANPDSAGTGSTSTRP